MAQNHNRSNRIWMGLLALASILLIATFGSFERDIWIDEFLHFALGSHSSTAEVWQTIRNTTTSINHGQTGFYMVLNYWTMQILGANLVSLRFPSLLSTAWLLMASFLILRWRGIGWPWLLVLVFCFASQSTLMIYVGEARPYMPLAAASMGVLAYYLAPLDVIETRWGKSLGVISVMWGVLMHPYFSLYWASLWLFSYVCQVSWGRYEFGLHSALRHVNIWLLIPGIFFYFTLGLSTWLRSRGEFGLDPFQWVGGKTNFWSTFIDVGLFRFIRPFGGIFLISIGAFVPVYVFLPQQLRTRLKPLLPPIALVLTMTILALVVSGISFYREYWILSRQWVASIALSTLGVVWLAAEFLRRPSLANKQLVTFLVIAFLAYLPVAATPDFLKKARAIQQSRANLMQVPITPPTDPESVPLPANNEEWVSLARANLVEGGDVWPIFRSFYGLPVEE